MIASRTKICDLTCFNFLVTPSTSNSLIPFDFKNSNAQSRTVEEAFVKSNIPYQIVGGHKFYDRKEIKDILAYLKVVANPADSMSFNRIINVPKRGLGPTTMAKFNGFANDNDFTVEETFKNLSIGPIKNSKILVVSLMFFYFFFNL